MGMMFHVKHHPLIYLYLILGTMPDFLLLPQPNQ